MTNLPIVMNDHWQPNGQCLQSCWTENASVPRTDECLSHPRWRLLTIVEQATPTTTVC